MVIDELSNMRTMQELEKEKQRAQKLSIDLEKRAKVDEYRLEQATLRMNKIEEEERAKCRKTAELLKEFEKQSGKGPFFESLLDILNNFLGK